MLMLASGILPVMSVVAGRDANTVIIPMVSDVSFEDADPIILPLTNAGEDSDAVQ
jgi:hypothetical protein